MGRQCIKTVRLYVQISSRRLETVSQDGERVTPDCNAHIIIDYTTLHAVVHWACLLTIYNCAPSRYCVCGHPGNTTREYAYQL